jgi:hypothetical protein
MPVTPSKFSFNLVVLFFGLGVAAIGVHDLKRRQIRTSSASKVSGRELVRQLHGDIDVSKQSQKRRLEQRQAAETRKEEWGSVQRYIESLIP